MSEKTSILLISIVVLAVTLFVYFFSVPPKHSRISVSGTGDSLITYPVKDSTNKKPAADK